MTPVCRLSRRDARLAFVEPLGGLSQTLVGEGIRGLPGDSLERGSGELPRTRVQS